MNLQEHKKKLMKDPEFKKEWKESKAIAKQITRLFKPYVVKRPHGNCQVLFSLMELDFLIEEILTIIDDIKEKE